MSDYIEICEKAARAGGAVVQDWIGRFDVKEKAPADLVTEADFASQQAVRRIILDVFPDHCVLGEEEDDDDDDGDAASDFRWIVDPLDGTINYVHRVPFYAVSLALEHAGKLVAGVVYDPNNGECFSAVAGGGAALAGQPIRVSGATEMSAALAAVGFPPGASHDSPDLALFNEVMPKCQAIRRTGSCALNLCYMAAGRFDVFWSFGAKIWDVAAGVLILEEAGGTITAPDGGPFQLEKAHFLAAATGQLHGELQRLAGKALPSRGE